MPTRVTTIEREYTEAELAAFAKQMSAHMQTVERLEDEADAASKRFKALIKEELKNIAEISRQVNLGFSRDNVEADMLLNTPEPGKKTYIDPKSGRVLKVEDMVDADGQSRLFDDQPTETYWWCGCDLRPDPAAEQTGEGNDPVEGETPAPEPSAAEIDDALKGLGLDSDTEELDRSHENRPRGGKRGRSRKNPEPVAGEPEGAPGPDAEPGEEPSSEE